MEQEYNEKSSIFNPLLISVIIVVLVLSLFYYFFFLKTRNTIPNEQLANTENVEKLSLEEQLSALNSRSKITIPSIKSEEEISSKNLPVSILSLFSTDVSYNKIKSVIHDSGSTGFEIELTSPKNTIDTYFSLWGNFKSEGRNISYGSRYEEAGIFNIEDKEYNASIVLSKIDESSTLVRVSIVNKKI